MSIFRDSHYQTTRIELELSLAESPYYSPPAQFVNTTLQLRFGEEYPEYSINRDCCEVSDLSQFVKDLEELANGKISELDYFPLEPDFNINICHSGRGKYEKDDDFSLSCLIDVGGIRTGVYGGGGFALEMSICRDDIRAFSKQLQEELDALKLSLRVE